MATVTHKITTADTTNGGPYSSGAFTPAVDDLIVVLVHFSGSSDLGATCNAAANGVSTFHRAAICQTNATLFQIAIFVAEAKCTGAASMTVSLDTPLDPANGADISVFTVSGMTKVGSAAVRQSAEQPNFAGGVTPAVTFPAACITTNPVVGIVGNKLNPAAVTPPSLFTEAADTGHATPVCGIETVYRNSGFTGTTVTWGSTSTQPGGTLGVELDASASGGTTPVSRAWSTSWNVKSIITGAWQTSWNVKASIPKSWTTSWDIKTIAAKSWQTSWNVKGLVSKNWSTSWDIASEAATTVVSKAWSTSWNIKSTINKSWSTSWNIKAWVMDMWSTTWNVKAITGKQWATTWNVNGRISKTWSTSWHIRRVVSKSWSTTWKVLQVVQKSWQTLWGIGGKVSKEWSTLWDIEAEFKYNVIQPPVPDYQVLNDSAETWTPVGSGTSTYDEVDKPTTIWSEQ